MRVAVTIILSLLALFTGGCSLLVTFDDYIGFNVLAGFGFVVCTLSISGMSPCLAVTGRQQATPTTTNRANPTIEAPSALAGPRMRR